MDKEQTKQLQLEMGCLCASFSEQFDEHNIKYDVETMKKYDEYMKTLNGLKFSGLFQHNQINKAYDKLAKKVFDHVKSIPQE